MASPKNSRLWPIAGTIPSALSDAQLADRIRDDRIDILVDLALHTLDNRLLVFARKPAPVQVTMLGMPATTGLATMDYRLTDPYLDPPGATDGDYTEQSIRLPHCFWCYEAPVEAPPWARCRRATNGFVTFGCLNQFPKVSRPVWPLWVQHPSSPARLAPGPSLPAWQPPRCGPRRCCGTGGIAGDRVEFVARGSQLAYFQPLSRPGSQPRSLSLQRSHQHAGFALDGRAGDHAGRPHRRGAGGSQHPVERWACPS